MVAFVNTAEGAPLGSTFTTAASTGGASGDQAASVSVGSGNTFSYQSAAAYKGNIGYSLAFGTTAQGQVIWNLGTSTRAVFRFYFQLVTVPTVQDYLASFRNATGNMGHVTINSSGKLVLQNASGSGIAASTATNALSAGVWYRVEAAITKGTSSTTGRLEYAYYLGDSLTAEFSYDSGVAVNTGTTDLVSCRIGRNTTGTGSNTRYYDDLAGQDLASGWLGPSATPASVTAQDSTGTAAALVPSVSAGAGTEAPLSTASGTAQAPTVGAGATLAGVKAVSTTSGTAPGLSAGSALTLPRVSGTVSVVSLGVSGGSSTVLVRALGTSLARPPAVSVVAGANVQALRATASGLSSPPGVAVPALLTAPKTPSTGSAGVPQVLGAVLLAAPATQGGGAAVPPVLGAGALAAVPPVGVLATAADPLVSAGCATATAVAVVLGFSYPPAVLQEIEHVLEVNFRPRSVQVTTRLQGRTVKLKTSVRVVKFRVL